MIEAAYQAVSWFSCGAHYDYNNNKNNNNNINNVSPFHLELGSRFFFSAYSVLFCSW